MQQKRPFIDYGDLLILFGVILMFAGFYLIDWRLALIYAGAMLAALGMARLRRIERKQ